MKNEENYKDILTEYLKSFSNSTELKCSFYESGQGVIFSTLPSKKKDICAECRYSGKCDELHEKGITSSVRFGGRYIYSCRMDMAFSSSPVMHEGKVVGGITCGPIRMLKVDPSVITDYSNMLFAISTFISDTGHEMFVAAQSNKRENLIAEKIASLKDTKGPIFYPIEKEDELIHAVELGNGAAARAILDEILSFILIQNYDIKSVRSRINELYVLLSRAAIIGGANTDNVLELTKTKLFSLNKISSRQMLVSWLSNSLDEFLDMGYKYNDSKHARAIHAATAYILDRYATRITLEEVSEYVGYSSSHFSRIFNNETGKKFKEYVNDIRIERSKFLLLNKDISTTNIGVMVGFSDQSYFCKVFKAKVGIPPEQYRKRTRRIDSFLEYANK